MTRKDYELIAKAIAKLRSVYPDGEPTNDHDKGFQHGTKQAAQYIASALASDNPRFDRDRFLKASRSNQPEQAMQLNTYMVFSRVMANGKQVHTTSDRVNATTKEAAAAKIEARGNHEVTSVSYVGRCG